MTAATGPQLGQSTEDYLKAIFKLEELGPVGTSCLAEALDVSAAAVSKSVQQLAERGYVNHRPYRGVSLTAKGRKVALEIIRHHRLLELFLHDVLGYGWHEVDAEAERLEHHISEEFEARIDRLLNYPSIDPHGDPIPSREGHFEPRTGKPLADCEAGDGVMILRVCDRNPEALKYLGRRHLRPGTLVKIVEVQPFNGPLTLQTALETFSIGKELAGYVFVKAVEGDSDSAFGEWESEKASK